MCLNHVNACVKHFCVRTATRQQGQCCLCSTLSARFVSIRYFSLFRLSVLVRCQVVETSRGQALADEFGIKVLARICDHLYSAKTVQMSASMRPSATQCENADI